MIPTNLPIEPGGSAPARRGASPVGVVLDQGIGARQQDGKVACQAVVELWEHAAVSGKPEGNETLVGPLWAAAVTAGAGSSASG